MSAQVWTGQLLNLGHGGVLLRGSALADVVRALEAAQRVTQRDGFGPDRRWLALHAALCEALMTDSNVPPQAVEVRAEVPHAAPSPWSEDAITTQEAATMLDCGARNVRDLHRRGVLDSGRLVAGRLLLSRAEVVAEAVRRRERAA